MQGKFIVIDGGDGAGKSTQLRLLRDYLLTKNIEAILTKEPGGTEVGLEIRRLLVEGDPDKMDAIAEALLYYADRRIHLTKKIWPALEEGDWVLSDRFADSTMAYQYYGYGKRVQKDVLEYLYKLVVGDRNPDLTIIIDLDPEVGLARSFAKSGQMEFKELRHESRAREFHHNLREGFLEIAKTDTTRYKVVNGNQSIEGIHKDILKIVDEKFFS